MTGFKRMMGVSALALAAFLVGSAALAGTLENVKARGKLVVGVKNDYAPYGYLNDKGDVVGFEVSLAKYLPRSSLAPRTRSSSCLSSLPIASNS